MGFGRLVFGIVLIGVGGLLLAARMGYIPAGALPWLLQYWPVLLVAIGLALLANAIQNPLLGWIAVVAMIAALGIGALWAHKHGAPSKPAYEALIDLDRPRVGSLTVRARVLGGKLTLGADGASAKLLVDVRGVGDRSADRHRYTATMAGALLEWPSRVGAAHDAPLGGELHVRAPPGLPVRLEAKSLLSSALVDLRRLRSDRVEIESGAGTLRLDLRGPSRPRRVLLKGFLTRADVLLPASCPVRIEFASPLTTRSLPEDFVKQGNDRAKGGIWTSEGSGAPLTVLIEGPLIHLNVTREAVRAI